jgi:hypothetical protein
MNTTRPTLAVILASFAASAASLTLAVAPALGPLPQTAQAALRVVELPRVVITAAREPQVVELERVVVSARRSESVAGARSGAITGCRLPLR